MNLSFGDPTSDDDLFTNDQGLAYSPLILSDNDFIDDHNDGSEFED